MEWIAKEHEAFVESLLTLQSLKDDKLSKEEISNILRDKWL